MRIFLLITSYLLFIVSYSQEQNFENYFDYVNYNDNYFKNELKLKPDDSVLLKKLKKYERVRWFWDSRIDSNGEIYGYNQSLINITKEILKVGNSKKNDVVSTRLTRSENSWIPIDPIGSIDGPDFSRFFPFRRNVGKGNITAIWVDPENSNHVLIGNLGGGVFETYNALEPDGNNVIWKPLTDNIPARGVSQIDIKNGVIYARCGFDLLAEFSSYRHSNTSFGVGLIRSYDNGGSWQVPDFSSNNDIPNGFNCKGFQVMNNNLIYAVDKSTLFKSNDDGEHWEVMTYFPTFNYGSNKGLKEVVSNPNDPNFIWIGFMGKPVNIHEILMTTDGGQT